jgi:2-keto-3-deoxygluconate permease
MKIKATLDRIPGGLMLVPLFLGAAVRTFTPDAGKFFGSFTNGLMTGTVPILAVWFFCIGASIDLRATGTVLRKSGTLVLTKIAVAWVVTLLVSRLIPTEGITTGVLSGLSTLAIISAMDMTNGGLYASLMTQYGSKEEAAAFVLMSIESGPLVTMLILGASGVAAFEPRFFVGAVLPFVIGFALSNLDRDFRPFFARASQTLIPFFGFALGNTIDLKVIVDTGLLGIFLGVAVVIVTGVPLILADRFLGGGNGVAGLAASSTAGAAVANPLLIAGMNPAFLPAQPKATALVAASVVVTAILVPVLTALYARCLPVKPVEAGAAVSDGPVD